MTDETRLIGADHLQFKWQARAEAAEAERDKLREALRQIATPKDHKHGDKHPSAIARAALADKEGT